MSQSALNIAMSVDYTMASRKADSGIVLPISDFEIGSVIDKNRSGNIIITDFLDGDFNDYMDERVSCIVNTLKGELAALELKSQGNPGKFIENILHRVDQIIAREAIGGLRSAVEKAIFKIIVGAFLAYQPEDQKNESDEFDPKKLESVTMFWADREKKTRGGRSAIEFLIAVYGDYGLGRGLNKAHIKRHDPKLYMALMNWARDDEKKQELEKLLPSGREKYLDISLTEEDLSVFKKVQALKVRRHRGTAA